MKNGIIGFVDTLSADRGPCRTVEVPANLPPGVRLRVEVIVEGPSPSPEAVSAGVEILRELSSQQCLSFEKAESGDVHIAAAL